MRYLSLLNNGEIVAQTPAPNVSDEETQDLDEILRRMGKLNENEELAITQDVEDETNKPVKTTDDLRQIAINAPYHVLPKPPEDQTKPQ